MPQHTDRRYEEELAQLKTSIVRMGSLVQLMTRQAMRALMDRDASIAKEVIEQEQQVNQLELRIDDRCLALLALRQPAASDLRFIAMSFKISTDLERMGDLAVNIAQRAMDIGAEAPLKTYVDLPLMAQEAQTMVEQALDAFLNRDPDRAKHVCEMDDRVDALYKKVYQDVIALMQNDPDAVSRGIALISISRHLERIADHATNIAEEVIYMVKGKDIRHGGELK